MSEVSNKYPESDVSRIASGNMTFRFVYNDSTAHVMDTHRNTDANWLKLYLKIYSYNIKFIVLSFALN